MIKILNSNKKEKSNLNKKQIFNNSIKLTTIKTDDNKIKFNLDNFSFLKSQYLLREIDSSFTEELINERSK